MLRTLSVVFGILLIFGCADTQQEKKYESGCSGGPSDEEYGLRSGGSDESSPSNGEAKPVVTSKSVSHNNLYWQSGYVVGNPPKIYCDNLTIEEKSWRLPTRDESIALCENPHQDILISRAGEGFPDNESFLLYFGPSWDGIQFSCSCMGYVGGNCPNENYCGRNYNCGDGLNSGGWATKCVSDP